MRVRLLVASLVILLSCCALALPSVHASPAVSHPCAPLIPPPVSGTPAPAPATPGIVLINELLTNPASTWNCAESSGVYSVMTDSWLEIYNPQNAPLNLYAAHASIDGGPNTPRYYLPFGAAIAPHGFLVIFPNLSAGMLQAGGNLRLLIADVPVDMVSVPMLASDDSYARIPDGSTNWQITIIPTIDASNIASTGIPAPTPTRSRSGSGTGGSGGHPTPTTPALASGTQPAWSSLHMPPGTLASPATVTPGASSPLALSAAPGVSDLPRRIWLTALLASFLASLWWCWKVFTPRHNE